MIADTDCPLMQS